MQATRILPDLQASLLCEEVRQESNGNFFLIGVIDFVRVPQIPITAAKLSIFNCGWRLANVRRFRAGFVL